MSSKSLLHALLKKLALASFLTLSMGPSAQATSPETFMTLEEALKMAFPKAEVKRQPIYLSEEDEKKVGKLAGVEFKGRVFYAYRATRDGKPVGTAYFDTHRVRSLRETLMVVVSSEQKVSRIEVLAFAEPTDYIPRDVWYDQFLSAKLDSELRLNRRIKNVTGATLTARATTLCSRRILAMHQYVTKRDAAKKLKDVEKGKKTGKKKDASEGKKESKKKPDPKKGGDSGRQR